MSLVLANAKVLTLDPARPAAEAVGLAGGMIAAAGTLREVRSALPGAPERDMAGATIVPGLVDAHGHLLALGRQLRWLDLTGAASESEAADRVERAARATLPRTWILGRGWDQNRWDTAGALPGRAALDAAAPKNPVYLQRIDGHAAWVNGLALAEAGIGGPSADPPGGRILRDGRGVPTGTLLDTAAEAVAARIPEPGPAEVESMMAGAAARCASLGLTSVHDAGTEDAAWEALVGLSGQGRLPIRVYAMARARDSSLAEAIARGPTLAPPGGLLERRAVKFLLDGALGSRGAALFEPYADEPANPGLLLWSQAELEEVAGACVRRGFQLACHAIGDRANALAIDLFERLARSSPLSALRPRLEHAQVLRPEEIRRAGSLGLVASVQPVHATSDMGWAGRCLGPIRLQGAYAWASLKAAGCRLAFGSDFPVEDPDPRLGLFAAVARTDAGGRPAGGWLPTQRLTPMEALEASTSGAAWAAFAEGRAGRIARGMQADLTAFDLNPLADPAGSFLEAAPVLTVVGGRVVFERAR